MTHSHIKLVTAIFSQPEHAEREFRSHLPPDVSEQADWSTLKLDSDAVADPELQEGEGDLLFSVRMRSGEVLLLRMLLRSEHMPTDRDFDGRLVRHAVRQLRHWREQHPEVTYSPAFFPIVIYFRLERWPVLFMGHQRPSLLN